MAASNTQPQSYVLLVTGALFLSWFGPLDPERRRSLAEPRAARQPLLLLGLVASLALLAPAGVLKSDLYPALFYKRADLALAAALALLAVWAVAHARGRRRAVEVAAIVACVAGSLLLRRVAPPIPGRLAIVAFAALALSAVMRGRPLLALGFGIASYAWVSRDLEFLALLPSIAVAELLAKSGRLSPRPGPPGTAQLLLLVGIVFGLVYVQRVGLQGALDIGAMDWGAGGFRDPHVPAWLVGAAIVYKYVIAELLVIATLVAALDRDARERFLTALLVTYLAREAVLLAMLLVCGGSFWTAQRVLGDLPFALTGALATALVWSGACGLEQLKLRSRSPVPAA